MYNFDEFVDRQGTGSEKWNLHEGTRKDMIFMGTADMDFRTAPQIIKALKERAEHGIFGYTSARADHYDAIVKWCAVRYGLDVKKESLLQAVGVVYALKAVMDSLTEPGDKVMILTPVYPPFFSMVRSEGRTLVECPLLSDEMGRSGMNYAAMRQELKNGVRLVMLCNPHNPIGRLWSAEELTCVIEMCSEYGAAIVSDDIHCDIKTGGVYTPILSLDTKDVPVCQLISATKTFNLAGLHNSTAIIPDAKLRERVSETLKRYQPAEANIFALEAQYTAYMQCEDWLEELLAYISVNKLTLYNALKGQEKIKYRIAEGTYLAWLDCRALGMDRARLEKFFLEDCGIAPVMGADFGAEGFARLNLATTRSRVEEAANRLVNAAERIK